MLLGAAVGTFVTTELDKASLESWGWRVPFIVGMLIGPVGFYIRNKIDETPTFQHAEKSDTPLRDVFSQYPRETLASFSMVVLWTICTYVLLF